MLSQDYRSQISKIIRNSIKRKFPGLKKSVVDDVAVEAARAIHARFYGADVDGVASPIWRDHMNYPDLNVMQPNKTAQELLDA